MKIKHREMDETLYEYTENMWTGKKTLNVNGTPAVKYNKNQFKIGEEVFTVKGNILAGVKLVSTSDANKQVVIVKNQWWEWIFIFLPWLWWAATLVPYIGGWIWSLIGAAFGSIINTLILRSEMNILFKIVTCFIILIITFAIWFGLSILFASLLL